MFVDFLIVIVFVASLILFWIIYTRFFGAEWVRMPKHVRQKILQMLKLNKKDIFYDLGCGDGQLLVEAIPYVKKAVGIEIDPIRFLMAKMRTSKYNNTKIIYGNLFKQNINATKIAIFLSPEANAKLGKKLKRECKAIVASYKWPVQDLKLLIHNKKFRIYLSRT